MNELSKQEIEWTEQVRSSSIFEFVCPSAYEEYSKLVQRETRLIPTRAGDTLVYGTRRKSHVAMVPVLFTSMVAASAANTPPAMISSARKPQLPTAGQAVPDDRSRVFTLLYTGAIEIAASPYTSPYFAPDRLLPLLPDTAVITGGLDGLHFEAEEFAKRMVAWGGMIAVQRIDHSRHRFIINCLDEWVAAQALVIDLINK